MLKRIVNILLGVIIAVPMFQVSGVAAEEGYYWLEAEDAVCSSQYKTIENENASGGKLMGVYETTSGEYTVEFSFDNQTDTKYDIWFLSGKGNIRKLSKFKWSVNEEQPQNYASTGEENSIAYSGYFNENDVDIQWNRVAAKQQLAEGENTIKFIVSSRTELNTDLGEKAWFNLIDSAVIVPSDWKWTPNNLEHPIKPEKVPSDFVWVELEDPDMPSDRLEILSNSLSSGGKMLYADSVKPAEGTDSETLEYSFYVDKETKYDVWYLGIQPNVPHLSRMYWSIDSDSADNENNENQNDIPTIYTASVAGSTFPMYWQNIGMEEMSVGEHTFYLRFNCRTIENSVYLVAADCVILVPSELNWKPNEENLSPSQTKGELVSRRFADTYNEYFNKDFSSVKEDIELPDEEVCRKFLNQIGAKITFSADEFDGREVISQDGKVTRPYASASGDASIGFYINASYTDDDGKEAVGKVTIPMTVKKWEKYEVVKELSFDKNILNANETISASAKLNIHTPESNKGIVTLVMALYDNEGKIKQITMSEKRAVGTVDISASMSLPENVAQFKLKAYLINGFVNANQLTDSIEIGN